MKPNTDSVGDVTHAILDSTRHVGPTQTASVRATPPPSQLLIHRLTPDPHTPTVSAFRTSVLPSKLSLKRRARLLAPQSHFSFVNPLPVPFPYDIEPPGPDDPPVEDKGAYVEEWLTKRGNKRTAFVEVWMNGTLMPRCVYTIRIWTRQELVDVFSGQSVLAPLKDVEDERAFAPWSPRYSGHQFGSWAGQLGDGRAISILTNPHLNDPNQLVEIQLKGAGCTPFSRSADGLAVVRSSVREYLCSEVEFPPDLLHSDARPKHSHHARTLPPLPPRPPRIVRTHARLAPSFEALNGPQMHFFGSGQQEPNWEGLRLLEEWVQGEVLELGIKEGEQ
ncbi:hypothetical protein DXG01_011190 [Tephrocybe rancida]|nr:hypothetical protein DXG01_011190 [Tephrocybe rancida]